VSRRRDADVAFALPQLCALAFFIDPSPAGVLTLLEGARQSVAVRISDALAVELDDLGHDGPIGFRQESGEVARPSATLGGGVFRAINLERIAATALVGEELHRLMRLDRIPESDRFARAG
jgi:hypothetical protein